MAVDPEELFRRYGPMVQRRCATLLRDPQRAMEATQDVFVQVLRRREILDIRAPSSLLYQMATNVSLNHLRSQRRRPETSDDMLVARIAAAPDTDERVNAANLLERLFSKEPASTRASTRAMAVMHLVDGMTLEEVARETDMSVSGVRKRLRILREHLHELDGV